jgi:hypothetical protein
MWAPVVEIADILGHELLQMALNMNTWSRHSDLTDLTQRSAIALAEAI